MDSLFPLIR